MMTTQSVTNSEEESMVDETAVHDVNVSVLNEPSDDAEEAYEVKFNGVQDSQITSIENNVDVVGPCRIGSNSVVEEMTNGISVIPLSKIKISDEEVSKSIVQKFEAKNFKVKGINVHRDAVEGYFIRSDVRIEPVKVSDVKNADFEFSCCVALSCPQKLPENG